MENINRGVDDAFYRYKMPKLLSKIEGNGNGIKTVIPNMKEIAKSLSRPPEYPTKFFGFELGAQTIMDDKTSRYIVNGAHDAGKLASLLDDFIKKFVLCSGCGNPETDMILKGSKKDKDLYLTCKACGKVSMVDPTHKLTTYVTKNPPPNAISKKDSGDKKGKKGKKDSSEEDNEEGMPEPEELSAELNSLSVSKEKQEDPAETFAQFISSAERTPIELQLEASKLDINTELAAAIVIQVLLEQSVVAQYKKHKDLLKQYVKGDKSRQKGVIGGIERLLCVTHPDLLPKAPQILKLLYDDDIVEEEQIIGWHEKPSKKYAGDKDLAKKIRDAAQPLIDWLKNAEEESDDE